MLWLKIKELLHFHVGNRGKCVYKNVYITIKNKKTGKIEDITIGDFFNKFNN